MAFAQFLRDRDSFGESAWTAMVADQERYKAGRKSVEEYRGFAVDLVGHYAQGLAGKKVTKITEKASSFLRAVLKDEFDNYRLMSYAKPLVDLVQSLARTIAISGSPEESLIPLVNYLGIEGLEATRIQIRRGKYTERVELNLALGESKRMIVGEIVNSGINFANSFAFGDTMSDVPMFENVGNPVMVGNNQELKKMAVGRNWAVFDYQDDIVGGVRALWLASNKT